MLCCRGITFILLLQIPPKVDLKRATVLYQCDGKIWLEIDKGFSELDKLNPLEYFSDPDNYRILLSYIPTEVIKEWKEQLEKIEKVLS